jgi:hypothetical protein
MVSREDTESPDGRNPKGSGTRGASRVSEGMSVFVGDTRAAVRVSESVSGAREHGSRIASRSREPPTRAAIRWSRPLTRPLTGMRASARLTPRLAASLLSLLLLFLGACAHLPSLSPISEDATAVAQRCRQAYPRQPWSATHAIFATLPFGNNGGLIGVTSVNHQGLHSVLLSPEGISLFEGLQDNSDPLAPKLRVDRAVPPFDRSSFSASLMADVGHAFLPPAGAPTEVGRYASGETVCRWIPERGESTDIELGPDGPRVIRTFLRMHVTREIFLTGTAAGGFYPTVILSVPGAGGYRLEMRLVDHE